MTLRTLLIAATACGGGATAARDAPSACSAGAGWSSAPGVLGGPIVETAVVAVDGKVVVLGGFDASFTVVSSVRVFDPAACAWSDGPALPRPLHHANAAVVGSTVYIVGALDATTFDPRGDVLAWTPAGAAAWAARTSMPAGTERGAASVAAIGDTIYVAGGLRGGAVATVSAYSTTTDTWTTNLPPLPLAGDHGCAGAVGGTLYAIGGRDLATNLNSAMVFAYTPGGAWVAKAAMPTARGGIACGVAGDRILVAGGEGNPEAATGVYPQLEAYTAGADRWDVLPAMVTPRHGTGGAVVDGALYVPGGADQQAFAPVDTNEAFRF